MWRFSILVLATACAARSGESLPLQVSLWPPVQVVCADTNVAGLRLNLLYGDNVVMQGLDLGVVSGSDCCDGIQINAVNWVRDLALGVQIGLANTMGAAEGLTIGGMNTARTTLTGVQIGILNYAEEAAGLQIGLLNSADTMVGLQIGLVNIIHDARVPALPILNWQF